MSGELLAQAREFPTVKEMSEWIFDALRDRSHGETIKYGELSAVLTVDAQGTRGRHAVLRAARRLLEERSKLLVNVRGVGYEIVQPNEHAAQSKRLQGAARRRLVRAVACATHVLWENLTAEERSQVLAQQLKAGLSLAFDRRISRTKALPPREQVALPSGGALVRMLTKKQ